MNSHKTNLLILLFLGIAAFFIQNKVLDANIMEARNIVTAREMVNEGHWIVPTMNGELRLEKPPLPTWIAGLAESISPDNISLQRDMAGLAALLLMLFMYLLAFELSRRYDFAMISTLVLITMYNVVLMGRTATWDIYCHAFMLGAIYYLYKGLIREGTQRKLFVLAGVFLGLSFLSKGPVAFFALLLPFLMTWFILGNVKWRKKGWSIFWMIIIMLVLSSFWYVILFIYHHDTVQYVLNKESTAWINHHVRPWYYYSSFISEMGVWAFVLITAILSPLFRKYDKFSKENLFFICWMLLQVILLSCFPEKKKRYLLPVTIPVSLAVASMLIYWVDIFKRNARKSFMRSLYKVNAYIISVLVLVIPIPLYLFVYAKGFMSLTLFIVLAVLLLAIAIYLLRSIPRLQVKRLVYGVAAVFFLVEVLMMPTIGELFKNPKTNTIANTRNMEEIKDIPFYHLKNEFLRIEIVYSANRHIYEVEVKDSALVMNPPETIVLMTRLPIEQELSKEELNRYDITFLGHFDDNRKVRRDTRERTVFDFDLNILRPKNTNNLEAESK